MSTPQINPTTAESIPNGNIEDERPRVLAQDQAQRDEGKRKKRDMRNPDIQYREALKLYNEEKAVYDKELKKYNEEIAKYEKQKESEKFNEERLDARWYSIPSFNESNVGEKYQEALNRWKKYKDFQKKAVQKTYMEKHGMSFHQYHREYAQKQYQKMYGRQIAHNEALNKKFGGRPKVSVGRIGILSRSVADRLNKSKRIATPIKQYSAAAQRQIRLVRLQERYNTGNMTLREFYAAKGTALDKVAQKQAAEQARRNWSSAISARSALVQDRTAREHQLRDLRKQNRLGQMAATTAMNQKVLSQLKSAGVAPSELKQGSGRPRPDTMDAPVKVSRQIDSTEEPKPRPARSIFDIPQAEFAAIQAGRGLDEEFKISSWQSSDSTIVKRKESEPKLRTSKLSPLLLLQIQKQALEAEERREKDQNRPLHPVWTVGDKEFTSLRAAEEYQKKQEVTDDEFLGVVSMTDLKGESTILDNKRYDDFGKAMQAGFSNALRYADAVDFGEVERKTFADNVLYYAGHGVKPITDIGYSVANLLGKEYKISPTLSSTITDVPIQLITEGKTKTHDPIGDYVKADPLRTIIQIPAEAALWVSGGKAIEITPKVIKRISPVGYITPQVEGKVIYRGLGYTTKENVGKPIIGIYQGEKKLTRGYKPEKIPWKDIDLTERTGGKVATATGLGQRGFFYSDEALAYQVKSGYINPLSKLHAEKARALKDATMASEGLPAKAKFDPTSFKHLDTRQAQYSKRFIELQQKKDAIESIHGSMVVSASAQKPIKALAGDIVKIGDVDVTPKFPTKWKVPKELKTDEEKTLWIQQEKARISDDLLAEYAKDFPLKKGQSMQLGFTRDFKQPSTNKGLKLITKDESGQVISREKVFEVVMTKPPTKETQMSRFTSLFRQPPSTKILDTELPSKTMKVGSSKFGRGGMKFATMKYQILTQFETAFAHQKWESPAMILARPKGKESELLRVKEVYRTKTPHLAKLDTPAKASIMPQEGRIVKDPSRTYIGAKIIELNQIRGMRPNLAKKTSKAAEEYLQVHPEINLSKGVKTPLQTDVKITDTKPILDLSTRTVPITGEASRIMMRNVLKPTPLGKDKAQPKTKSPSSKPVKVTSSKPSTKITSFKPLSSKVQTVISRTTSSKIWSSSSKTPKPVQVRGISSVSSSSKPKKPKLKSPSSSVPSSSISSSISSTIKTPPKKPIITPTKIPTKTPSKVSIILGTSARDTSVTTVKRKKATGIYLDNRNTTKKKKNKQHEPHDFLGNVRLDHIEGIIGKRREAIHGDRRLPKQIQKDKRLGFETKVKIF